MTYESLLNTICQLGTKASSQNTLGEWTYTWTYTSTDTDCRMNPISASKRIELIGRFDDVKYRAFLKSGTSISVDNRVQYSSKGYRVRDVHSDSEGHHVVALISEL